MSRRSNRIYQGLRGRKILESLNIDNVTNLRHSTANEYKEIFGNNHQLLPAEHDKFGRSDCHSPNLESQMHHETIVEEPGPSNLIQLSDLEPTASTSKSIGNEPGPSYLSSLQLSDIEPAASTSITFELSHRDLDLEVSRLPDSTLTLPYVHQFSLVRSWSLSDLTEDKNTIKSLRKVQSAPMLTDTNSVAVSNRDSPSILLNFIADDNIIDTDVSSENDYHPPNNAHGNSSDSEVEFGDMNLGRKRRHIAEPTVWKRNLAKIRRMKGEDYLGYSRPANGKFKQDTLRNARQLGERCKSEYCKKSKLRGCNEISEKCRQEIHTYFWKQLNWDQRKIYVKSLIQRTDTARKTKKSDTSRRKESAIYYLPIKYDGSEKVQVCKLMFLNSLSLGSFTVYSWTKAGEYGMIPNQELHKSLRRRPLSNPENDKAMVLVSFFDKIPKLPSHYVRRDTTKIFLEPIYHSLADLFKTFINYCTENQLAQVSRYSFEKYFHKNNFSLYTLKKDMCDVCSSYKVGNLNEADYQIHLIKKDRARKEKEDDKNKAAAGESILLTMDLEAVKVCPFLTASSLYFKTKLTVHNFTLYNVINKHCTCYWFDETAADLTSNTFVSFIINYLEKHCLNQKLPIIIFSDGCTYQNRNAILSNALLYCSNKHNITIIQKFLEPGHTQMECDSIHSAIERQIKNKEIHLPSDYVTLSKSARASNPYECIQIDHEFVKDYAAVENLVYKSIRPGRKVGDPHVVDIRAIKYEKMTIEIKLNFDQDWMSLPQRTKIINEEVIYNQLHSSKIPIKATKFNHLQQLKAVLPSDCHYFYDSLPFE